MTANGAREYPNASSFGAAFHPVCSGQVHIGAHIIPVRQITRPPATVRLTFHQPGQFRMGAAGLSCDGPPPGVSFFGIGRSERIALPCRQTRLLPFRDTRGQAGIKNLCGKPKWEGSLDNGPAGAGAPGMSRRDEPPLTR